MIRFSDYKYVSLISIEDIEESIYNLVITKTYWTYGYYSSKNPNQSKSCLIFT
jgi:hypothetical protein